jgi:thiamine biosynthesis protein ThiS
MEHAMKLVINGENKDVAAGTVAELIESLGLTPQRVAVEVNEALVKRDRFGETPLHAGDHVEIVTLVGGG